MNNKVVSSDEWLQARQALLEQEKALTRLRDEVAEARRAMPWTRVETDCLFHGPEGPCRLSDLFAGKSQLITYHYMFGPDWQEGCKSCSFWADQYDTINLHIGQRDVALAVISSAPWQTFLPFKQRMGWKFNWVSAAGTTFNHDYHVTFDDAGVNDYNYQMTGTGEEMPGLSVFYRDADGNMFHTYSCYARGLDPLNATYQMLDLVPRGRDEAALDYPMAWVRLHDQYTID